MAIPPHSAEFPPATFVVYGTHPYTRFRTSRKNDDTRRYLLNVRASTVVTTGSMWRIDDAPTSRYSYEYDQELRRDGTQHAWRSRQ